MRGNFEREITDFLNVSKDERRKKKKLKKKSRTQSDLQSMTDNHTEMSRSELTASYHDKTDGNVTSNSFAYDTKANRDSRLIDPYQ